MEEEKIIQGPQKLHTENPEEIEDMLSKKVDGVFADGANLDTLTLKNSSEIELKIVKLKEEIDQKIQEINSFDTQHSNLSKGEIEIKQNTLVDDLVTLANRQQVLEQDNLYKKAITEVDNKVDIAPRSKGGLGGVKKLTAVLLETIDTVNKKMSDDYKKLEKSQEDLDQTQEDITRLRAGVDVDFSSRGMTEKLTIEEKINLLNTDFEILSERIPLLEKKLHENQTRMNTLVNIINPEAKTS